MSAGELRATRGLEQFTLRLIEQDEAPSADQLAEVAAGTSPTAFVLPYATVATRQEIASTPNAALISYEAGAFIPDYQAAAPVHSDRPRGRVPWGKYALMRALLRRAAPRHQHDLADEIEVTQGAVSSMLVKLGSQVLQTSDGWSLHDTESTWHAFLAEYPGPGGSTTYWHADLSFERQVELLQPHTTVSGDAAADRLEAGEVPGRIVAYAAAPFNLEGLGFSWAAPEHATVELVFPDDRTVFATARAWGKNVADPALAAWDSQRVAAYPVPKPTWSE